MINIIQELLNIEEEAKKILDEIEKNKIIYGEILEIVKNDLGDKLKKIKERGIFLINKKEIEKINKMQIELDSRYSEKMDDLERKFIENKDAWIKEILEKIIGE
ncbi:MAG: hypothetical protein LBJ93_01955 [Clostridiales bacterium]|nr:hypothetical protein [Clostridiales bacterium]